MNLGKLLLAGMPSVLTGCSDPAADGEGTVTVTAYGESFVEDAIPASEMEDGWSVSFDRFVVTIREVHVGTAALSDPDPVDLAVSSGGDGHELGAIVVGSGSHSDSSYSVARVDVEGRAEKGGDTKTFRWVFDEATSYRRCETTTIVPEDGSATFQITIHADHLFYDTLVSSAPRVLFQALADADEDADGEITRDELSARDIGAYDPGNEDIDDLWSWLVAQHRTLGHVDGEGHCDAAASGG